MKSPKNRLHKVMVVGATPAGVAAANKLGELGISVTLVDSASDLNEKLGDDAYRLNSGVPLNFAHRPGLIRILRNPGIRVLLPARVQSVKHNQQGFTVKIDRQQTFVDPDRCTLCGQCTDICPLDNGNGDGPIRNNGRLSLPGRVVIDKRQEPLCQANCPLGVNAQGYIALARAGKYEEALDLVRKENVLPGICGRVCHHPCESACRRGDVDAPLAIRDIKRFLADTERQRIVEIQPPPAPTRPERIAVVGSGPAGIAAAADLARQGYGVTVFEKEAEAGGMLRYAIGPHRLPREILDRELAVIRGMGVDIRTASPVSLPEGLDKLKETYQAVIVTTGSWADRKLGVPGEDLDGVRGCLSFLQEVYRGTVTSFEKKVAVIGDGNAAFDMARVLHRLGARVTILSWFPKELIPADEEEVTAAEAEGITLVDSLQTVAFSGAGGRFQTIHLKPAQPGEPDENGIPWPVLVPDGEAVEMNFEHAFVAIGQRGAYSLKETGNNLQITPHGFIAADEAGRTSRAGVYAAGDAATGASSVVQAMANGRLAAASVYRDLTARSEGARVTPNAPARPLDRDFVAIDPELAKQARVAMPETAVADRQGCFQEVAKGYDEMQAKAEAERCLQCGSCAQCLECIKACNGIDAVRHAEAPRISSESVGVMIIADAQMAPGVKGEDVIRAYGPPSAKPDIQAMTLRGFAAAAKAMVLLRDTGTRPRGHGIAMVPPDPGLSPQVRIGVFACRCNDALGWDPEMDAHLAGLTNQDDVVCAEAMPSACVPEGINHILDMVREKGLTRLVLASCVCCPLNFICSACTDQRSRLKAGLFSGTGISRAMVQTINLRGEVLRLMATNPRLAKEGFAGVLARSIRRAANLLPFPAPARTYNFTTAVIGQTEAAMSAAGFLADAGLEVFMFGTEKYALDQALDHPNIHLFPDATVTAIGGSLGNFRVQVRDGEGERTFPVGGIILGDKARNLDLYRQDHDLTGNLVYTAMQKRGVAGVPFMHPGTTSVSGLFLADPPGVQISKRTKGAAAAVLAAAAMPRGPRQTRGFSVAVKENLCRSCGRCLQACPYHAIGFQPNGVGGYAAAVDDALCKGCGNCISVCPSDAADSPFRDHAYLEQTLEDLLVGV